ncbi:TIGR03826 family flagellar region protein [Paenibacillus sp. NEAU-GSW1]|uniref:TIGR03826 family flagellar region protein n=1 Tax=Paenibacillus sp. NEAU-GSW1 TaxID=2682486 RepID=UPI0012E13822|nr:TIGR03826 family flagellar region protein [Paenibacillus sp. NEAU-GSW1]MUT65022.1 flagellar protein [Paenibacillus sp. NEAU-GSW1]
MTNIENCPRCGRIFAKHFRDVCPSCLKDIDKEYELCSTYLRENKGAIITELSESTGVSIRQITKFVREGRISLLNAPNLSYPCEVCGTLIRESNLCDNCRTRFQKDAKKSTSTFASRAEDSKSSTSAANSYRINRD